MVLRGVARGGAGRGGGRRGGGGVGPRDSDARGQGAGRGLGRRRRGWRRRDEVGGARRRLLRLRQLQAPGERGIDAVHYFTSVRGARVGSLAWIQRTVRDFIAMLVCQFVAWFRRRFGNYSGTVKLRF